jgi:hypothetical protein
VSIIYDALQKTQRNRSVSRDIYPDRANYRARWIDIGLIAAVVLLSAFVIYAYWPLITNHFKHASSVKTATVGAKESPPLVAAPVPDNLVLNGVLMSDQNQTALINNQFYHLGDAVGGMRIVSIELNNVKLQDGNKIVILKTTS